MHVDHLGFGLQAKLNFFRFVGHRNAFLFPCDFVQVAGLGVVADERESCDSQGDEQPHLDGTADAARAATARSAEHRSALLAINRIAPSRLGKWEPKG